MVLEHIDIVNFKNIGEASIDFSPGVNCLLGKNGMGKSNLLEAVWFLSFARGMSGGGEARLMRHGARQLLVKGRYLSDSGVQDVVACGITSGKGKTLKLNGKEYQKISEHIGRFPVVSVSPADTLIVTEGAELRRRLLDMVISQASPSYLTHLINYNRAMTARNQLLKSKVSDKILYESVESRMAISSDFIFGQRRKWTEEIAPILAKYYSRITDGGERASISYSSTLQDMSFQEMMDANRQKDLVLGYTSAGIHRDNLITALGDYSMRTVGSQGQVKSFAISLRLAIFEFLKNSVCMTPILLLDDIFDKLDASRVGKIMEIVSEEGNFGQIFVTDTNRTHLDSIVSAIAADPLLLEVTEGNYSKL